MGRALVCDAGAVSDPSSTITAVTAGSDSTFTVRNFAGSDTAELVALTRAGATKGLVRVRSPKLVDDLQGIRYALPAGVEGFLLARNLLEGLYPQDSLTVEVTGGAAEYDGAMLSTYYDNLPGAAQRLHMPGDLSGALDHIGTWEVNAAASATEGDWAYTSLDSLYNVLPNNTDIAILGYVCDTAVLGVSVRGSETSSLNIGGPGDTNPIRTRSYFADLSLAIGKPCIPVFNTGNVGNIQVGAVDVAASTAVNVTLVLAELSHTVTP